MSVSRAARRIAAGATAAALCVTGFMTTTPALAETVDDIVVPNGSFEEFTTLDSWVATNWSMTTAVWLTGAAARTGTYSQAVNQ